MSKVDHACFRAHAALAPHLQLPVDVSGALGHGLQSPMPGAHFAREYGRLDADFVVANANSIRQVASGDTGPLVQPRRRLLPQQTVNGNGREGLDYAPVRIGGTDAVEALVWSDNH